MSALQIKYEDVLSEVHTSYQAITSTLVNELAETRAQLKAAAAELERLGVVARNEAS